MAIRKITPEHRIKSLILDYETTFYNKLIRSLNAEGRDGTDESDMRHLIRHAQLLHEGLMAWYKQSLGEDISLVDGQREVETILVRRHPPLPVSDDSQSESLDRQTMKPRTERPPFLHF